MKELKPLDYKYKKYHNNMIVNKLKKKEFKHFKLKKGILGLKANFGYIIDSKQILSFIKVIARSCKRRYKLWIYCYPNVSLTAKSISVRMGKGIGNIINWIFVIKKNKIFLELIGKSKKILLNGLQKSKKKLSLSSKIIIKKKKKKKNNDIYRKFIICMW